MSEELAGIVQRVREQISRFGLIGFRAETEALCAAVERLTAERDEARKRLLTAAGDDLCRLSQEEIKAMGAGELKIPPEEEFLASCKRFHNQMAGTVGVNENCLTLAQLIAEVERLTAERDAAIENGRARHELLEEARAEVKRLKGQLDESGHARQMKTAREQVKSLTADLNAARQVAREALKLCFGCGGTGEDEVDSDIVLCRICRSLRAANPWL